MATLQHFTKLRPDALPRYASKDDGEILVRFQRYASNRRLAIVLTTRLGEPFASPSVNFPDLEYPGDEIFIKDYSENEGMTEALITAGVLKPEISRSHASGFTLIDAYRLTSRALRYIVSENI